jgi:hypothetical protein
LLPLAGVTSVACLTTLQASLLLPTFLLLLGIPLVPYVLSFASLPAIAGAPGGDGVPGVLSVASGPAEPCIPVF